MWSNKRKLEKEEIHIEGVKTMYDFNNNSNRGRIDEDRELNPLDERGRPVNSDRAGVRDLFNDFRGGGRGRRRGSYGGGGGGGDHNLLKILLAFVVLAGVVYVVFFGWKTDGFTEVQRKVAGTPQENLNVMLNKVKESETINKRAGKFNEVTDKNELLDESVMLQMPQKEYMVYLYSFDESNQSFYFDEYVRKNQKEYTIYKLAITEVVNNQEILAHIGEGVDPAIVVIKDLGKGRKVIDTVITKREQLENLNEYMDDLIKKNTFKKSEENYKATNQGKREDKEAGGE